VDTANAENAGGDRERQQVEKAERDEKRTGTLNGFRGALLAPACGAQETTLDIRCLGRQSPHGALVSLRYPV
jgi:hypothetical protein